MIFFVNLQLWDITNIRNGHKEASAHDNFTCIGTGHPDKSVVSFEQRPRQCLNVPMLKESWGIVGDDWVDDCDIEAEELP